MTAGAFRTVAGSPSADDATELEAVHAVADAHDERHVVLDDEHGGAQLAANLLDERAERLRLALRDAGGRFVEAEHAGVEGEQAGELDDATGAGGQVGDVGVGIAPEPEEVDELVGLGTPTPLQPDGSR